jgi:hypothetical protein
MPLSSDHSIMCTESDILMSLYIRLLQSAPNVYIGKTNRFVLESVHGPLLEPLEGNKAEQPLGAHTYC